MSLFRSVRLHPVCRVSAMDPGAFLSARSFFSGRGSAGVASAALAGSGGVVRLHAIRGGYSPENLEHHALRKEAGGAGAPARGGAPGGPDQPDQPAFPIQYPELRLVAVSPQLFGR